MWTPDGGAYGSLEEDGYTRRIKPCLPFGSTPDNTRWGRDPLLPGVDQVARQLRRRFYALYRLGVSVAHLDYYLDEFTFRRHCPTACSRWKQLLKKVLALEPDRVSPEPAIR